MCCISNLTTGFYSNFWYTYDLIIVPVGIVLLLKIIAGGVLGDCPHFHIGNKRIGTLYECK
ncbi:hypothetical protein [Bacillus smithii]|uniref:hypothetical protein n=1 Tax=Bacillus smithii TaxID=1479 RepID=UPI00065E99CF|nr:hypothetical protein [Bacillus smithii]AKP45622.1 hypothetical protein BSM4216_0255 [Bacillus smithii]